MAVSYDHAQDREEMNINVYQIVGVFFFSIHLKNEQFHIPLLKLSFPSAVRVVFAISHSRTGVLGLQPYVGLGSYVGDATRI